MHDHKLHALPMQLRYFHRDPLYPCLPERRKHTPTHTQTPLAYDKSMPLPLEPDRDGQRAREVTVTSLWQYLAYHALGTRLSLRGAGTTLLELNLLVLVLVLFVVVVIDVAVVLEARLDLLALEAAAHGVALLVLPALEGGRGVDLEAVAPGRVALGGLGGRQGGVDLEEDLGEGGAEVGAVNSGVAARLWVVEVLAPGAPELDGLLVGNVGQANGQEWVRVAMDAGAFAEICLLVLLKLVPPSVSVYMRYTRVRMVA